MSTSIRLADVSKYKDKNPIGTMLSGVLTAIIEDSHDYKEFKAKFDKLFESDDSAVRKELDVLGNNVSTYLQKQFPDGTTVRFTVNPPQITNLLKSFDTDVNDGIDTKAEAKGDGMQRAIMLAIIQAFANYRKQQLGGGTFLFMIDEAELHLHPTAQRALKRALLDICATDQVLVNTHSSVLVVDNHDRQKIFCVEKDGHTSNIREIDDAGKPDVVFDLLGGSPGDLLLPRNFLIIKGAIRVRVPDSRHKEVLPDEVPRSQDPLCWRGYRDARRHTVECASPIFATGWLREPHLQGEGGLPDRQAERRTGRQLQDVQRGLSLSVH